MSPIGIEQMEEPMPDYQPLDLSRFCNVGVEVLGDRAPSPQERPDAADLGYRGHSFFPPVKAGVVPVGPQTFRGLPFMVGPETGVPGGKRFLALDGSGGSVTVPIGQHARHLIFAHRLLENPKDGRLGSRIAPALRPIDSTHYDSQRKGIFAHTSPIYVSCGGDWQMFDEETARHMLAVLDGDLAYIRQVSVQHRPGTVTHHHGEADHAAYLERPFHEAREAILGRMRGLGVAP